MLSSILLCFSITELQLHVQVYLTKENNPGSHPEGALLAIGGRYDYLLQHMWSRTYVSYPHLFSSLLHQYAAFTAQQS